MNRNGSYAEKVNVGPVNRGHETNNRFPKETPRTPANTYDGVRHGNVPEVHLIGKLDVILSASREITAEAFRMEA